MINDLMNTTFTSLDPETFRPEYIQKTDTIDQGIELMIKAMTQDYWCWIGSTGQMGSARRDTWANFCNAFNVTKGKKYARVTNKGAVVAFVVLLDNDQKFQQGDILKPAGFRTPARNKPRGNVLAGGYSIAWTGPHYLSTHAVLIKAWKTNPARSAQ